MNPLVTLRVALRALARNKLRSFLTTLGIVIGVAAVIAMVAIGEGAKAKVEEAFNSMGATLLIVMPGSTSRAGTFGGMGSMQSLTWDDLEAIRSEAPAVLTAAAALLAGSQIVSEEQNWQTTVVGTSPEYFDVRSWPIARGAHFTQTDVEGATKVVVLGQTVVDQLFGQSADPVGHTVRIRNMPFLVLGVLQRKGQSPLGQDYDDMVFVPQTTFATKIRGGLQRFIAGTIYVRAVGKQDVARAQEQVAALLRDRHRLGDDKDDDFVVRSLGEMAGAQQESTETLTTLLASIAAVSLLVGGIGVMNIMLVSVTERTREIGIRMAVGAKPGNILSQFLVEALALSTAGGVLGVGLGVTAAQRLAAQFGWPLLLRGDIIALAVSVSAAVGIVFGLLPARKASQLDPIEALRYE